MDKSEPSLVPEWLRSSGSATGSGGSSHHFASSQSDGSPLVLPKRNNLSKSAASSDSPRSSFLDRSSPSNSRRSSSSNGSGKHEKNQYFRSYSSFSRSQRDRERDKLSIDDHWDAEYSDPLRSIMTGRVEKDILRRSQSMVSRKQTDVPQRSVNTDSRGTSHKNRENTSSVLRVTSTEKVAFDRDFPSLGSEDRPITPDIGRVPSPGLSRSLQGLSISNSSSIGVEGWTSALAEVPVGVGSNTVVSTLPQPAVVSSVSAASSSTSGLNMAEALAQAPSRSQTALQPSMQSQKREELAVLQSMRLIPMTASTPKNVHSDKLKSKSSRPGDQVNALKNAQQLLPSLQLTNQSLRGASAKNDSPKTSHTGKLLVLKPGRENGISPALKDISSPTGAATGKFANGQGFAGTPTSSVAVKDTGNPKHAAPASGPMADKKPSMAHAQSRSDFFNMMRKKSMTNSVVNADPVSVVSSALGKLDEPKEGSSAPANPVQNNDGKSVNGDASEAVQGIVASSDKVFPDNASIFPDEEEAAFLRSLGWDENDNAGDDEGLTEEEINAFYQEYMKLKPASKLCRGLQLKIVGQGEPGVACSGGASSELSASDSSA